MRPRPPRHPVAGSKRRPARGLALALAIASGAVSAPAQESLETAIKASYLTKFGPFVAWPPAPPAQASSPFTICVAGRDPFGPILDRAIEGQHLDGRPLAVMRLELVQANPPCQVMFLGGSRSQDVKTELKVVRGAPVLTVTDGGDSAGIIDFVVARGRVRFRLNDQAAADNGLTISSKLLSLAISVIPRKPAGGRAPDIVQ